MSAIAVEFVTKARSDWSTAGRELAATSDFNADAVCFHSQQCIEKLKAMLIWSGQRAPRTHDLFELDRLLRASVTGWASDPADLKPLAPAAVDYRYPGVSASRAEAEEAFAAAERLRTVLVPFLALHGASL